MGINLQSLATIAQTEFADLTSAAVIIDAKLGLCCSTPPSSISGGL